MDGNSALETLIPHFVTVYNKHNIFFKLKLNVLDVASLVDTDARLLNVQRDALPPEGTLAS